MIGRGSRSGDGGQEKKKEALGAPRKRQGTDKEEHLHDTRLRRTEVAWLFFPTGQGQAKTRNTEENSPP